MKHLSKYYWAYLAVLALFLCIDIEFEWILMHCCSTINGKAVNNIILALSYSYIAAAIFHYIVVFLPYKKKKKAIIHELAHLELHHLDKQLFEFLIDNILNKNLR